MTEHTKEPWAVGQYREIIDAHGLGVVVTGFHLSTGHRDSNSYANARRIVACVNACAGISTEVLEYNAKHGGVLGLEKQRDRAERALINSGWAYEEGAAEWKPPIGPSASPLLDKIGHLAAQRDQLQEVCAEAYQFAGAYDAPVEVLDNLHAAANGLPLPHESFLPVDDSELVKQRDQLLEALVVSEHFMLVACDWNMDVIEINGEMRITRDLLTIVQSAIAAVKGE